MRKISARRNVLLVGVALLLSCAPPHVIDDEPATAPGTDEREPAEPDASDPDGQEPERSDDREPGSDTSGT